MQVFKPAHIVAQLFRMYPWAIPLTVLLGTMSSLSEGIGISLFIPLFESLMADGESTDSDQSVAGRLLGRVVYWIPSEHQFVVIALFILAAIVLKNLLAFGVGFLSADINSGTSHRLRSGVFRQLLSVRYDFLTRQDTGKLMNALAGETWRTGEAAGIVVGVVTNLCTAAVFSLLLLLISWRLALLVFVSVLGITCLVRLLTNRVEAMGKHAVGTNQALTDRMLNVFHGMRVIRVFGNEAHEQERFERSSNDVRLSFRSIDLLSATVHPVTEILYGSLLVSILVLGVARPGNIPNLLVFALVLFRLQYHLRELDWGRVSLRGLTGSAEEVMSLLDEKDKPYARKGGKALACREAYIELEAVTFRYRNDEPPVLMGVTADILQGAVTHVAGLSGAGKSTLVNLVCGLYEVESGEIRVDGTPLRQLDLAKWRRRIGLAGQDAHLLADTIRANIAYGRLDATDEQIEWAARVAHAHDLIEALPDGYQTRLSDTAVRLSGGECQRIALARALVREPDLLILDEATSEVDGPTEQAIWKSIRSAGRPWTVLAVAHRISVATQADMVLVLEKGILVEKGSPEALLGAHGRFEELARSQSHRVTAN